MRRRDFIAGLGGAAVPWSLSARAQQSPNRMRRVGVLMGVEANDPDVPPRKLAFEQELERLGWFARRNLHLEYRFAAADPERMRTYATELIQGSEVIVGHNTRPVEAVLRQTRSVPVVFIAVGDPLGSGFVASIARPGGNATGFVNHAPEMGGKWLSLLREAAPEISRAAILYNPETAPGAGAYFADSFDVAAKLLGLAVTRATVKSPAEIASTLSAMADSQHGIIIMPDTFVTVNRAQVLSLATAHRLPAIYPWRYYAADGGMLVYGVNQTELFRLSATYVDRILRGENPADLPVQAPTRFELIVNLKTAKAIGLTISPMLLARADEVIE